MNTIIKIMKKDQKKNLVSISAKVPKEIRDLIEKKARIEDRSVSHTISRLFSTHPELTKVNLVNAQ